MTGCECLIAGFCERHKMTKAPRMVELCQADAKYFAYWERKASGTPIPDEEANRRRSRAPVHGPGTELNKLIIEKGYKINRKCGCLNKVHIMNRWGADKCRAEIDTIIGWLEGSAKQAGWLNLLAVTVPGVRQIARAEIRSLVNEAIDRVG